MNALQRIRHGIPNLTKGLRVLTMGGGEQNFIGGSLIRRFFAVVPTRYQRGCALRMMAISPHYFSRQWFYPSSMTRRQVLEAEDRRLRESRRELVHKIIKPYTVPQMTVVDFGCGPGYLATQIAPDVRRVFGVDISEGVLLCAARINDGSNIEYIRVEEPPSTIEEGSVDLIYSFAVFQHLTGSQLSAWLNEFHRLLRPNSGLALCHVPLSDERANSEIAAATSNVDGKSKYALRFQFRSRAQMRAIAASKGFRDVEFHSVRERFGVSIDDDINNDYMMVMYKAQ